ncbi:hypothetical protein VS86_02182 [Vibrio cholerae]|nr:hypothetical protein VS86_02182 [Vibrio cholerae]
MRAYAHPNTSKTVPNRCRINHQLPDFIGAQPDVSFYVI